MEYNFEKFHKDWIMTFIHPFLKQIFLFIKTMVDVAQNPERHIKNNELVLEFFLKVDDDKYRELVKTQRQCLQFVNYLSIIQLKNKNLAHITPREFEHIVGDLFRLMGYKVELTPKGPDFGADIIAKKSLASKIIDLTH